jgi:hypothetical protein
MKLLWYEQKKMRHVFMAWTGHRHQGSTVTPAKAGAHAFSMKPNHPVVVTPAKAGGHAFDARRNPLKKDGFPLSRE